MTAGYVSAFRHRIAQQPHARDLDLDRVAGVHEDGRIARGADAARRARRDDVAGAQLGEGRAIGDDGVRALAECLAVVNLRHLSLWGSNIGITDAGAVALASSPYLRNLERMELDMNPISDAGALAILRSPHLVRLTHASLCAAADGR